jgi:hypothetical protein
VSTTTDNRFAAFIDENEIRRVLHNCCRGIDRLDLALVRDCYWPEATDRHGTFSGSRDEFLAWVEPLLRRHTMTMHHLGNITIDLGGDTAYAETYAVAYHSGEPAADIRSNYAAGFRYVDAFERREGCWRIAERVTAIEWLQPWDADRERLAMLGEPLPRRDRLDLLYRGQL